MGKLNLSATTVFEKHRSGWEYCMSSIAALHHPDGILFDDFIERSFSWEADHNAASERIPYRQPWVGILHNPPNMPDWYYFQDSPQSILQSTAFQESLRYCKGIYTLSEYNQRWLKARLDIPIELLSLATDRPLFQFTIDRYSANSRKKLIQIGTWLRKLVPFTQLDAGELQKIWLIVDDTVQSNFDAEFHAEGIEITWPKLTDVRQVSWVEHEDYDRLLSENLVFVYLFDASANNIVVECIVRNTPLLINPLPAVVEYLGEKYPFYFSSLEEAQSKLKDDILIAETHCYLKTLDKRRFTGEFLAQQIRTSTIYKNLPTPNMIYSDGYNFTTKPPRTYDISLDPLMRHIREQLDVTHTSGSQDQMLSADSVSRIVKIFRDEALRENISNWHC